MIEKIQKTTGVSNIDDICINDKKNGKDDLWVVKYRPQKFTQLITMDVRSGCNIKYRLLSLEL